MKRNISKKGTIKMMLRFIIYGIAGISIMIIVMSMAGITVGGLGGLAYGTQSGMDVRLVAHCGLPEEEQIWYAQSLTAPKEQISTEEKSEYPDILVMGNEVWVVWVEDILGSRKIYAKHSPGSDVWEDEELVTEGGRNPSLIGSSDGKVWVFWISYEDPEYKIKYKIYDGTDWSSENYISGTGYNNQNILYFDAVRMPDDSIRVYYSQYESDTWYHYYLYSDDDGVSWTQENNDIGVEWRVYDVINDKPAALSTTSDEIKYSYYDEGSWNTKTVIDYEGNPPAELHLMSFGLTQSSDGTIWVVWNPVLPDDELHYSFSTDNGDTWSGVQIIEDPEDCGFPAIDAI